MDVRGVKTFDTMGAYCIGCGLFAPLGTFPLYWHVIVPNLALHLQYYLRSKSCQKS